MSARGASLHETVHGGAPHLGTCLSGGKWLPLRPAPRHAHSPARPSAGWNDTRSRKMTFENWGWSRQRTDVGGSGCSRGVDRTEVGRSWPRAGGCCAASVLPPAKGRTSGTAIKAEMCDGIAPGTAVKEARIPHRLPAGPAPAPGPSLQKCCGCLLGPPRTSGPDCMAAPGWPCLSCFGRCPYLSWPALSRQGLLYTHGILL
jgi:hypothetical protein